MPLIGNLLVGIFSGLVAWLTQFVTRKVAFGGAMIVAYSALTVVLYGVMRAALIGLNAYTTGLPAMILQGVSLAIPPAAPFCISTYITVWTACTVWTWQRDLLFIFAKAG